MRTDSLISLCDIILTFGTNFSTKRLIGRRIGGEMIIRGGKPLPTHSSDFFIIADSIFCAREGSITISCPSSVFCQTSCEGLFYIRRQCKDVKVSVCCRHVFCYLALQREAHFFYQVIGMLVCCTECS